MIISVVTQLDLAFSAMFKGSGFGENRQSELYMSNHSL